MEISPTNLTPEDHAAIVMLLGHISHSTNTNIAAIETGVSIVTAILIDILADFVNDQDELDAFTSAGPHQLNAAMTTVVSLYTNPPNADIEQTTH